MVRVNKSALRALTKGARICLQKKRQEDAEGIGNSHAETQQGPEKAMRS